MLVVARVEGLQDRIGSVANHDEVGARLGVEHLLELGHERIAHLTMSPRAAARPRRSAYEETMAAGVAESVWVEQEWDGGVQRLAAAVGESGGPTAVFASNDRGAAA